MTPVAGELAWSKIYQEFSVDITDQDFSKQNVTGLWPSA